MYIPYRRERVLRITNAKECLVLFVDIHKGTLDLIVSRGSGEVILGVPFSHLAPMRGTGQVQRLKASASK